MSGFVDNYLLFQLAAISHSLSAEFYTYLRQQGVNPARWRVLVNLMDEGRYVSELVHKTMFEQSRVTKIIDQLTGEGLVERQVDVGDRRRVKVVITEAGRDLVFPLIEAAQEHETRVMAELPKAESEAFRKALNHFVTAHFEPSSSRFGISPSDNQKIA